jgi:hypothetical protein
MPSRSEGAAMLTAELASRPGVWAAGRARLQFAKLIYFVQMESGGDGVGPIKIGRSDVVRFKGRLDRAQVDSPYPLRVLATIAGDERAEDFLHQQLSAHCMRGEWFLDCEAVRGVMSHLVREHGIEALR